MRRKDAVLAGALGLAAFLLLLPRFDAPLPRGLRVTRSEAKRIADAEARRLGIDVDAAWPTIVWETSPLVEKEVQQDPALRRRLDADLVVGPRLAGYRVVYYRKGLEKDPEYGSVVVGRDGAVLEVRRRARAEEPGAKPSPEALRPEADRFVASRAFPGAPGPLFESARPTQRSARTDTLFRYRVPHEGAPENVTFLLGVHFIGDRLAGWELIEEYRDGRAFRYESGGNLAGNFGRFASLFGLLALLLAVFLKKYHAGEVGVGTGGALFAGVALLSALSDLLLCPMLGYGTQFGGADALTTAIAIAGFKLLFWDLPVAALVFFAWTVGESHARERWGDRLASFDALLRRDLRNATVGGSVLNGLLLSPAVAAAALLLPAAALALGKGYVQLPSDAHLVFGAIGGPLIVVVGAALTSAQTAVAALLFPLASARRKRGFLLLGLVEAAAIGILLGCLEPPIGPMGWQLALGFGGTLAAAAVFLWGDLLAAGVALFSGSLLYALVPFLRVFEGPALAGTALALAAPLLILIGTAAAGLASGREVSYHYEDLAPHVKRIVERERVKAEIDAANRIQAALLPPKDPQFDGAQVASHYAAATEIGGDYFDFLPLPGNRLGLAFGDVAGHGLTSGIVMAMAKSALLVQASHDPSPCAVMDALNDIVLKTAPKRMLMTFFFGSLDLETGELEFCSAGHLDPYVVRRGGGPAEALSAWGFPLGVRRRHPFVLHRTRLEPGDRLVLYSDGLIEAIDDDGEPFGFSRFEELLARHGTRSPEELRKEILNSVKRFTRNRPPEDDQTLVILAFEGSDLASRVA
jgi:hypothetical protein